MNHEGGNAVGKALADHEVPAIGQHRLVEPGDVAQEVIEAVAGDAARRVQVDAAEGLHNFRVIGDGEVRGFGLAEALDLHVFAVVLANGDGGVDNLGNQQHALVELRFQLVFLLLKLGQAVRLFLHLGLDGLGLLELGGVLFGLAHEHADLLGEGVAVGAELVRLGDGGAALGVQVDDLVHQGELAVLEFLLDVLLDGLGVLPDEADIKHDDFLLSFKLNSFGVFHVKRRSCFLLSQPDASNGWNISAKASPVSLESATQRVRFRLE